MSNWSDEELRRLAFDYVRGELSMDESEVIESRMVESKDFEDYIVRLSALMRGAKEAPAELHHSMDADALFGRIAEHIHASIVEPKQAEDVREASEDEVLQIPSRRPWGLLTLAAALVGAILVWVVMTRDHAPPVDEVVVAKVETIQDSPEQDADQQTSPKGLEPVAFDTLEVQEMSEPSVRIFANEGASFTLEGDVDRRLEIKEGTVLIEYLPRKGERLSVVGSGFRVQVTGTVFYVSDVNDGVVGVVTGSVLVIPEQGTPIAVRGGQEYLMNEGLRAISPAHFEEATQHVTVEDHLDRLAMARVEPAAQPAKAPSKNKVSVKMPAADQRDLREQAQKALQERRYEEASSLMERLLEHVPASDPIAGATRLDLARIYLQRLNKPQKAAFHLKRFVLARPSDAATPSAKAEFCRIIQESGRSDALCLP